MHTNYESFQLLEKKIEKAEKELIELKRYRNSLLGSVRLPIETLGYIFVLAVGRGRDYSAPCEESIFGGLKTDYYGFLLVCHRWSYAAFCAPELWNFWGNNLPHWRQRYRLATSFPTDLVLAGSDDGWNPEPPEDILRDAIRDRAAQDRVRQIHCREHSNNRIGPILSSLTPSGEATYRSLESVYLETQTLPELSDFFARSRLPGLQHLHLHLEVSTPLWDFLGPQTGRLTFLSLRLSEGSLPPTTPQLLSILGSLPELRELSLSDEALPEETDESDIRVSLRPLRRLHLSGESRRLGLLDHLELPATLEHMDIEAGRSNETAENILLAVQRLFQDYFRRDTSLQGNLGVSIYANYSLEIIARCMDPRESNRQLKFSALVRQPFGDPLDPRLSRELLAAIPPERVVDLESPDFPGLPDILVAMPNVEHLRLHGLCLSEEFLRPGGLDADDRFLPKLQSLQLTMIGLRATGWKPLVIYLTNRTSSHKGLSLHVSGWAQEMSWEVLTEVREAVEEFEYFCGQLRFNVYGGQSEYEAEADWRW